jgi:2-desacetyl-2-hydroxyethyl bacteriochlorophyllide A dehydrogenase
MSIDAHAVVFTGPNQVSYQSVTCPDPGPDQVVVRLTHSWISNGTEGSYLRGERIAGDTARRDGDPWPFPIVAGYQKVGVVEWVGGAVGDLVAGDVVFAVMGAVDGMFEPRGGHVSPSVTGRSSVWKLPPNLDPVAFSGLVLTQVGYNCGVRPTVEIGQAAVVLGDGLVGQWAAQTLAWRGARVAMVGRHPDRLNRFAPEAGSAYRCAAIDATRSDWLEASTAPGTSCPCSRRAMASSPSTWSRA